MDDFDFNNMGNLHHDFDYDSNMTNGINSRGPPQLSQVVPGQGDLSQGRNDIMGGNDDDDAGSNASFEESRAAFLRVGFMDENIVSFENTETVNGDEGLEDSQVVCTPGCPCTCHNGLLAVGRFSWEASTPIERDDDSPSDSMIVEHTSSSEQSVISSQVLLPLPRTPSEYSVFMGSIFPEPTILPTPMFGSHVTNPLRLSPDFLLPRMSNGPFYYATELSMREDKGAQYPLN